jgi:2-C-methyl-D-erythritol 2,4-cyclodiphosphate synthase
MLDKLRIGTGYDVHAFETGRPLVLGGIQIPSDAGLKGHSDADCLIHAVVDSILGALRDGDIGKHFPSSEPRWKNAPSTEFLKWTKDRLAARSATLLSLDAVIITQKPKLRPFIDPMRSQMAEILDISPDRLGLKATTTDYLGFEGRGEGLAVQAVCLLAEDHDNT